jgi:hypothetical protein
MGLDDTFLELLFDGNDNNIPLDEGFNLTQQFDDFLGVENTTSYSPLNSQQQQTFNFIEPIEDITDEARLPLQTRELTFRGNNIAPTSNNTSQAHPHPGDQNGAFKLFEVSTNLVGNLDPVPLKKVRYITCSYFSDGSRTRKKEGKRRLVGPNRYGQAGCPRCERCRKHRQKVISRFARF